LNDPVQEFSSPNDRILAGLPVPSGRGKPACFQDHSQFFDFDRPVVVNPRAPAATKESEKLGRTGKLVRARNGFEFRLVEMGETRRIRGTNGLAVPARDTHLLVRDHDPFVTLFQYASDADRNTEAA
jgi:hypothetical protein